MDEMMNSEHIYIHAQNGQLFCQLSH